MKRKIKLIDNTNGKVIEDEVIVRDKSHLDAQIKFPHLVQRDRTKYTRKVKHKNLEI